MELKSLMAGYSRAAAESLAGTSPAGAACFRVVSRELDGDAEPAWWQAVRRAWSGRFFPTAGHAASLLVSAIHSEALAGHELKRHFPTCGGKPGEALEEDLSAFLAAPPHGFLTAAGTRETANYSAYWSRRWTEPAQLFFGRRKLPFVAVELNSIGGLGVCSDLLRPDRAFDSRLVTARVALAERPLNLADAADARWVNACYLPDDVEGAKAFDHDLPRLRWALKDEEAAVQGAACPPALAAEFAAKRIPVEPDGGLMLLSWNILWTMPEELREAFAAAAIAALGAWGDRGLWVALERDKADPSIVDLRVYRMKDGRIAGRRFASMRPRLKNAEARQDAEAAAFLA